MAQTTPFSEPRRVEEPGAAQDYSRVLTQVASEGKAVIVRRNGADLAAVVPLGHLELLRELMARQDMESLASQIDWKHPSFAASRPPQEWFDDSDNPFQADK